LLRAKPAPVAESIEPLLRLKKIAAGTNEISTIPTFPQGDGPENGPVIGSEGNLHRAGNGVDYPWGFVFELPAGSHTIKPLATSDNDATGSGPSDLFLADGYLYGTTGRVIVSSKWGRSSIGRAPGLQPGVCRFDPGRLHLTSNGHSSCSTERLQ
jgi:hypothetical protein